MTNKQLTDLGFSIERGGAHSSRTMMLDELTRLLDETSTQNVTLASCKRVILEENCLGKRSAKTRQLTYRHLVDLYSLDGEKALFDALMWLWLRDVEGRALIAVLCVYARDAIFRAVAPSIIAMEAGIEVKREAVESLVDAIEPDRFSPATRKSTAQNINATLTKTGHLMGRAKKIRTQAHATPGAVVYALYMGYLRGERGLSLFESEYARLLDCPSYRLLELARVAAEHGWIQMNQLGDVIEVRFPYFKHADAEEYDE